MNYILNTTFEDLAGRVVRFDNAGDGLAPYRIYNLRRRDNSSTYEYFPIGRWEENTLHMNAEKVLWTTEDGGPPVSACSADCAVGQIKLFADSRCCWVCYTCEPPKKAINEFTCSV